MKSASLAALLLLAGPASAAPKFKLDNVNAPLSIAANRVFADEFDFAPPSAPEGIDERDDRKLAAKWRTSLWFGSGYARQGGGQGYYADQGKNSWQFASAVDYNPFSVKDGVLSITATPMEIPAFPNLHYASGILTTVNSFYIDYGYFEIRAKCPGAPGNWTAFFMYPADDFYNRTQAGFTKWEMDFMEILGADIDRMHVTTHQKDPADGREMGTESVVPTGRNDDDFHVFGFDKQPGKVIVYRDGKEIFTKPTTSKMTSAGYLCLVLDVGKNGGWAGTPDPKAYPQSLQVDYVRAYKTKYTTTVGGPWALETMGSVRTDGSVAP